MYQEFRPEEAGAGEGRDVDREVLLGDDAGIAWDGGGLSAPPDGVVAAEMDEQIEHVMDAVLERVIAMGAVDGGPAVAAHEPRMSRAMQRKPRAARQRNWWRQPYPRSGQPWTKMMSGPVSGPQAR